MIEEEIARAYSQGYDAGYEKARQETFRGHYEKLCKEIRESVIEEMVDKIRSFYSGEK